MIGLTLAEVANATGGRLDAGTDPEAVVSGAVTIDSRAVGAGDLFVALPGERVDGHDFAAAAVAAGAVAVLATRSIGGSAPDSSSTIPAVLVDDPVTALGLLARAVRDRLPDLVVVGVTGSSGKTSTKDLIAAVLARAGRTVANVGSFNNEIGAPLTVLTVDAETRFLVVEMGARGVGHIAYLCGLTRPDIGVVLNVGAAHAGEFGGREATARAKGELVEALAPAGLAVLNADDPLVSAMAERTQARVTYTGISAKAQVRAENVSLDEEARAGFDLVVDDTGSGSAGPVRVQLAVHGAHHVGNALAAAAVGLEAGLPPAEIAAALSGAGAASRWRMEVRRRDDGLVVVNDAYNANPDSMSAALHALVAMAAALPPPSAGWAVLGEMLELGAESVAEHRAVGRLVAELGLAGLVAVGPGAEPIAAAARASTELRVLTADGVDEAVTLVQQNVRGTDIVLIKASRDIGLERVANRLLTVGTVNADARPDD